MADQLQDLLDELKTYEFKQFRETLNRPEKLQGFPKIPRSGLEKADRLDIVTLMASAYNANILHVAEVLFRNINRHDIADMISLVNKAAAERSTVMTLF